MSKNPNPGAPKGKTTASNPALTFEEALEQVESIIDRIERGEIGLEQSLVEYERGVKLIQHCRQVHKQAVQRVDELTQRLLAGGPTESGENSGNSQAADPAATPSDEDPEQ